MAPIIHDPEALFEARCIVRQAYVAIRSLRQNDPAIRVVSGQLDDIACELTSDIEALQPELPMRVGGGMART
jgi:hypothetical protein